MQPDPEVQGSAKTKSSWSRINKRPIELLQKARSWLGSHRRRILRSSKRSKRLKPPLKPPLPLVSSSSSSQSRASDSDIQYCIGPIEPDIPETHSVLGAVAGDWDATEDDDEEEEDEDTEVLLHTMCEAWSILASVAESQGCKVDDLTGEEVQQTVVQAYYICTAPSDHGDPVDGGNSSPSAFPGASKTAPAGSQYQGRSQVQGRGSKRLRSEDGGDGDGDGEDSPGRGRKRQPSHASSRIRGPGPSRQWFCQFYLSDPEVHRECLGFKLSRIVDVRNHILRKHLQQSHCPRCSEPFPNDPTGMTRSNHILACQAPQRAVHFPGATPEQWANILASGQDRTHKRAHGNRGRTTRTDEDEWFYIWDILFPEIARPRSPYVRYSVVVQTIRDLGNIFLEQGPAEEIVNDTLMEDTSPEVRDLLRQNIRHIINWFVDFADEREVHSRVTSTSQSRSSLHDTSEVQIPTYSSLPQSQRSQQPPSLAGSSQATYTDNNTVNEPGPAVVLQNYQPLLVPGPPKIPHSDQSLLPIIQDTWQMTACTGPPSGLTALQANPQGFDNADASPEYEPVNLPDEEDTQGALLNPHYAI